ncbi:phosphatidylinositol 4-phosphate 3-kinase C2 domain-containing subunit beta isoform X2 [Ischnura elegans]|uniref:phosphatidylinositol 4-phosphate 3-kinase C2 domain-containing subunit beta isoform X2 n=1 Tax=Ischnura elegans TaxID=197161 RepID=UPI001ED8B3D1|nr:phosphatidylinositol 4-phosphate 3-kinase C2 domain-containing subunit beta isoform X2 [Ischnura elegans]
MDNSADQGSQIDYDLKFQEDLEKARALSLESLALEKFRLQKLERLSGKERNASIAPVVEESENESASSQKDAPGLQLKARPRPGSFNSGVPRTTQIIAPPPATPRRNSASAALTSRTSNAACHDLISFNSPSPPERLTKGRKTYDELTEALSSQSDVSASAVVTNLFPESNNVPSSDAPLATEIPASTIPFTTSFPQQNQLSLQKLYPHLPTALQNFDNHIGWNPGLTAPSIYPQLPIPTPLPSGASFPRHSGGAPRPLAIMSPQDTNLDVLRFMGKIDNNNLIDLTPYRSSENGSPRNRRESTASIRTSLLETFDPLLLKAANESLKNASKDGNISDECGDTVSAQQENVGSGQRSVESDTSVQGDGGCSSSSVSQSNRRGFRESSVDRMDDLRSEGSSIYDIHDTFDFINALPSQCAVPPGESPYATVVKESPRKSVVEFAERESIYSQPPPLPPRSIKKDEEKRKSTYSRRKKTKSRLYENIQVVKLKCAHHDCDLKAFQAMVKKLRGEFLYSDTCTNVGLVISPTLESTYTEGTSIKLIVRVKEFCGPITFTCDVTSTVEHVILHIVCEIEGRMGSSVSLAEATADDFVLKVLGRAEYLSSHSCLADYEYVHQCIKLEKDVELSLVPLEMLKRPLARTLQDDKRGSLLTLDDLLPNEPVNPISHDTLLILLETLESEMEKVMCAALQSCSSSAMSSSKVPIQLNGVIQSVKAVTALLGSVETLEISDALAELGDVCTKLSQSPGPLEQIKPQRDTAWPEILAEEGDYSIVTLRTRDPNSDSSRYSHEESLPEAVANKLDSIREAVNALIETYCHAFRVNFQLKSKSDLPTVTKSVVEITSPLRVRVEALHRLMQSWAYDDYYIICQVYHGTRPVMSCRPTSPVSQSMSFYERIVFDCWLEIEDLKLCLLPRESRLVLTLYGRTWLPVEESGNSNGDAEASARGFNTTELGWVALQLFNYDGVFAQGNFLLSMWPVEADKILGPAPAPGTHPLGDFHPVLGIALHDCEERVVFPSEIADRPPIMNDFSYLDHSTQLKLIEIVEQDMITRSPRLDKTDKHKTEYERSEYQRGSDRLLLWEHRHYLHSKPEALHKVLLLAPSWDCSCLPDLHSLLHNWAPIDPLSALQLLLPCFPDAEVRKMAIRWVRSIGCDELVDYLPQLVQALKHEAWEASPLAHFLLERALTSPRVSHHLYWLLTQTLPGQSPQNNLESPLMDEKTIGEARYHRRLQLMLRALMAISGVALEQRFLSQQLFVKRLTEVAEGVKSTKESLRLEYLTRELASIHSELEDSPTCLPLDPSLEVVGIQVKSCSYFPSFTLPLKLNFISSEEDGDGSIVPAIFKVGDDLQQDMLTLQIVRIMDKLWLKEGLDLKMVTFACVPTGHRRGMIEMITNAETLRKIQVELGLTGSFKDSPIAEWLAKHNPSTLEYERAVENFTASCAGYSVATYILGICDRHNDNIMLKTSGHLFHIDFGKFLGDAQMFGNIKRDRTPFVLTPDMVYVINGGDKPTAKFHHFVDMCCQAFNIIRNNGSLLLNLFALMASSGIPGVSNAVSYVRKSLLPGLSEDEAAAEFAKMIQSSLRSRFTQLNFFLHNLAQLRFTGDHNDGELLSFIPKTYTMNSEGRIRHVEVYSYQKRYDPEKYYVYILKVDRDNQPDPMYLFRSYKEFCELHQKLCLRFPRAKFYNLSSGYHVGRSNIKQVAEKRRSEIERFLKSILNLADEISHSDLVYTFFHPLLRDQQESDIEAKKLKGVVREHRLSAGGTARSSARLKGQLKLSISYNRGALSIMVHHARSLPLVGANQEPSSYVKVYLLPDPSKATKRKTKIVRRNSHPSFMEMMEYYMPLETILNRTLQATIWNHDSFQENEFLGGVSLELDSLGLPANTTTEWFQLVNVHRYNFRDQ